MDHVSAPGSRSGWRTAGASAHLVVCLLAAVVAGVAVAPVYGWGVAALAAWLVGAGVFVLWVWIALRPLPAPHMARIAAREDAIRPLRDLVLLGLSAGTVVTVALVIFRAHENSPPKTVLGVACIAASWLLLHTVLTLRYARLYYTEPHGGVDFNRPDDPTFRDFAYLAFTVGMTFQVSDTTISKPDIRGTVLWHAVMSFVYDTLIIAVTINVIAGLSR